VSAGHRAPGRADVTAIVLAGGRSARFGGPKLEATIDGATVLDRALGAVDRVASAIVVAGPPPAGAAQLDAPVRAVPDDEPFAGPLAALSGALRATSTELAIVVGGDMPALVPAVLGLQLDRLRSDPSVDAVILEGLDDPARTEPLPLAVRVGPGSVAAAEAVAAGDRSLVSLLAQLRSVTIPRAAWRRLDPAGATTIDVDVRADLDRARGSEFR
jgi:molybdopterin-guanine dinucleotide biosynthesis protein A